MSVSPVVDHCTWSWRRISRAPANAGTDARFANVRGASVDLGAHPALALGELLRVLREHQALRNVLNLRLRDSRWVLDQLPSRLGDWPDVRNRAAHTSRVTRGEALEWRNELVGVGCEGILPRLGRVRLA